MNRRAFDRLFIVVFTAFVTCVLLLIKVAKKMSKMGICPDAAFLH